MRCPACQAFAPVGSRFCPACGRALADLETATRIAADVDPGVTVASGPPAVALDDEPFADGALVAGRYRVVRLLGRGGMGVVYQADDLRLGHPVALKFLPSALARDERRLAQFHNEASLARQVSHPNVCRVFDIGEVDGRLFLSMAFIDGEDLSAALARRGAFAEPDAVALTRQICAGLAAVHTRGILHRDLKPANIMINADGRAQLMDFGIAAAGRVEDTERISEGTPFYMAPEALRRETVTVQSDLYALGLVMYEIFTGHRLFAAKTFDDLLARQTSLASAVPEDLAAAVRPGLQQAVMQCLDPEPSRRPESASAVAAMLDTLLLDARTRWRRVAPVATLIVISQVLTIFRKPILALSATGVAAGILVVILVVALIVIEARYPLGWTVAYKGHRIRFALYVMAGERLYIDGALVDRGRIGTNVTLRGTIEKGDGAGERITAYVKASFPTLSCRIVAESFAP